MKMCDERWYIIIEVMVMLMESINNQWLKNVCIHHRKKLLMNGWIEEFMVWGGESAPLWYTQTHPSTTLRNLSTWYFSWQSLQMTFFLTWYIRLYPYLLMLLINIYLFYFKISPPIFNLDLSKSYRPCLKSINWIVSI